MPGGRGMGGGGSGRGGGAGQGGQAETHAPGGGQQAGQQADGDKFCGDAAQYPSFRGAERRRARLGASRHPSRQTVPPPRELVVLLRPEFRVSPSTKAL